MSSNDHKKFKTEATQKTSTDTEVISDAVLLPPYSTDHVLTVTAPSSTSSLTGQVDVELEMSPDGENWCPAQIQTITAGSATGGVSAEDANLNAVSTLPDPNAASPYTFTGNKFALGAKSYDASGTEIDINATPDSGTRDFMHQFMSKDKPFNYSAWLKTDTTVQPFGNDYTPVIFRHGGKDKFTNENVIQTDNNTTTQNLCVESVYQYATSIPYQANPGLKIDTSSSHYNVTKLSTDTNPSTLPDINYAGSDTSKGVVVSFQYKFDGYVSTSSGTYHAQNLFKIELANNAYIQIYAQPDAGYIRTTFVDSAGGQYYGDRQGLSTVFDGNWHHLQIQLIKEPYPTATQLKYYTRVSVDGGAPPLGNSQTNTAIPDDFGGQTISNVYIGGNPTTTTTFQEYNFSLDNVCFWQGQNNANADYADIYTYRNNPLQAPTTDCVLKSWFTMGDESDDRSNVILKDVVQPSSARQFIKYDSNSTASIITLSSSDDPYELEGEQFPSIFDASASSSISGWFKTPLNATGTLFSNTGGAAATGLKVDVSGSAITASYVSSSSSFSTSVSGSFNDGEWHHIVMVLSPGSQLIVVDNLTSGADNHALTDNHLRGSNGFTLLGDGQENAGNPSAASTDASKLAAFLSNWSLHTEAFSDVAISQLYSNGHVRNIKNLPSVDPLAIEAWWQFNDTVTPEQDPIGGNNLLYQDGGGILLANKVVSINSGPVYIVEEDQYGSGITMTLTKRFDTVNNIWTDVHTHPTCVCLSFNGFEDQAEYFAIYTHDTIDVADNNWHNLALSFSGKEGSSTNSTTTFSFDTNKHNFVLSIDGNPIKDAHFVGTLAGSVTNKEFTAQERHLKWDNNSEEDYIPHAQLNSNIFESVDQTTNLHKPVAARDYKTGFVGYADESSFHSESWFTDTSFSPASSFNNEKVYTLYGKTNALSNRGLGTSFPGGTPYPLRRPSVIGSSTSTANQYIDPERYDPTTNTNGGLEAWWRWGDTTGDCSVNINNAIGFESGGTDTRRSLKLNGTYNSDVNTQTGIREDIYPLTSSESIYVAEASSSSGGGGISLVNVIIENVQAGVCNLKNLTSPILQYIRVKFTNSGEAQLGEGKLEAAVHYRKRRER